MNTLVVALPNGKFLATYSQPREGFTVPEGILIGVYENYKDAEIATQEYSQRKEGI